MDSVITNLETWTSFPQLLIPIIMVVGTVAVAIISAYLTYRFTRKMQLEAEWRKDKIEYYRELLDSMSVLAFESEDMGKATERFALASNAAILIAPQEITDVLYKLYCGLDNRPKEIDNAEAQNAWYLDQLQLERQLILAMRRDLKVTPRDDSNTFKYRIRAPIS